MMIKLKEKKTAITAIALSAIVLLGGGGALAYARQNTESKIQDYQIEYDITEHENNEDREQTLFKNFVTDMEIAKQVCDKYGLELETVTFGEMTREMFNYEYALEMKKNSKNLPLLQDSKMSTSSLEMQYNDIHAFSGAGDVIRTYCDTLGIDPTNTIIDDLSEEQLAEIDELCYQASDHKDL